LGSTVAGFGVTAIDTSGLATVSVVLPEIPPDDAEMVVDPAATPVASPEALMVATDVLEEAQFADEVRFFVLPSL